MALPAAPRPPSLTRLLLTASLPSGPVRETIRADLDDEFERLVEERSAPLARAWYRRQARRVMLGYSLPKRLRGALGLRPWRRRPAVGPQSPLGRGNPIDGLLLDVRFLLRGLLRNPGFATVAILTLAIGIGITTTMLAVVDAVMLRPLPYEDPGQLVTLRQELPSRPDVRFGLSPANLRDLRLRNRSLAGIAALARPFPNDRANLAGGDEPVQVRFARASAEFFDILGVDAVAGRTFRPEDDEPGALAVAIISYGLWQRAFGGDLAVIGTTIRLDDEPYVLIGITPRDFFFAYPNLVSDPPDLWLPRPIPANAWNSRSNASFGAIARVRAGSTLEQARVDIASITAALVQEYPEDMVVPSGASTTGLDEAMTVPVESLRRDLVQPTRSLLLSFLGAAAVVLLLACINVANLLLERCTAQGREMSLRAAIGAGRSRLARQALTESAVLATIGGTFGLVLARWLTDAIAASAPSASFYNASLPLVARVEMSAGVLRASLIVCAATALCCGLMPALRATRAAPHVGLRGGGGSPSLRHGFGGGRLLAAGQITLAIVVLIAAGLLATTLRHLLAIPLGFEPDNAQVMRVKLARGRFTQQVPMENGRGMAFSMRAERARLVEELLQRLESLPGVEAAGAVDILPLSFGYSGPVHLEGVEPIPGDIGNVREFNGLPVTGEVLMQEATPGAFRALGVPLLRGRAFSWADDAAAVPVAVVNRKFVQEFGIEGSAVGMRALINSGGAWRPVEIVGVVDDVLNERYAGRWFDEGHRSYATVYVHYARPPLYGRNYADAHLELNVVVRHRGDASAVAAAMRETFRELAPEVPIASIESFRDYATTPLADRRLFSRVMGSLALVSVFLASIGIYGVMASQVRRRTHEVGVRMALGAHAAGVVRMIVAEGLRVALLGALFGILGALAATRLLESWLYEVSPTDPIVFTALATTMVAVALIACWIPARRAARVDPIKSLRAE